MPASVRSPASAAADAGNVTVTKPAGTVNGDLLLAVCFADPDGAAVTAPAGWTQVGSTHAPATRGFGTVFRKAASGEGASYVFTGSSGSSNNVMIVAVTGHDAATPVDVAATWGDGANATAHIAPSISPTGSDSLLVCGFYGLVQGLTASYTPPGGMAEQADLQPTGRWIVSSLATVGLAASGATGTKTATCTVNRQYIGVSVAIKSSGGGSTVNGAAAANFTFTAAGSGTRTVQATAAGTLAFTAGAAGARTVPATSAAAFTFTAAATGTREVPGAAGSTFGFAATAAGVVSTGPATVNGSAVTDLSFTATASSVRQVSALAAGTLAFTAAAAGVVSTGPSNVSGTAAAALTFGATATGTRTIAGLAAGTLAFTAAASSTRTVHGTAAVGLTLTAAAAGINPGAVINADSVATISGGTSAPTTTAGRSSTAVLIARRTSRPEVTHG